MLPPLESRSAARMVAGHGRMAVLQKLPRLQVAEAGYPLLRTCGGFGRPLARTECALRPSMAKCETLSGFVRQLTFHESAWVGAQWATGTAGLRLRGLARHSSVVVVRVAEQQPAMFPSLSIGRVQGVPVQGGRTRASNSCGLQAGGCRGPTVSHPHGLRITHDVDRRGSPRLARVQACLGRVRVV